MLRQFLLPPIETDDIENGRRIIRAGLVVIAVAFLGVGGWMAAAPLSGAVIAPGVVKVDTNRKTVQHQEGGIVKKILVRDGDRVKAGQTLIVLDDVRVDAALDQTRTQLDAELARNARLTAEGSLADAVAFPTELAIRRGEPRVADLIRKETTLFSVRRGVLNSQIELLRNQIHETQEEVAALIEQQKADDSAIRLQKEELAANEVLTKDGFVSKTRLLSLQRVVAEYEAKRGEAQAELAKARQKVAELELRILTLRNDSMKQATDELKESTTRVFDLQERLRPSKDAAERQLIAAPLSGTVVDLRVTTVGAAIGPRDPLLDIVPEDPDLIVEAHVRPEDINYVHTGSEADVRLTSFKQRITPVVPGALIYVSPDRLTERSSNAPYYVAHVKITREALRRAGDLTLQAGMPAEVFVKTAARTPLQYLFDPVTGYIRRAMREP
ncbi:MAG TPA: HlyD family type I secretion periplasmic adaptor subunit [Burkholderiales bacterium]|nr:HlyD family type I secretion periplasmic adaptor subunit [Burkholderiales bacterium]